MTIPDVLPVREENKAFEAQADGSVLYRSGDLGYMLPADQSIKVSAVKNELAENLTSFMIPEFFVKMPFIPLNTNGKPDMARLPVVMKAGNL